MSKLDVIRADLLAARKGKNETAKNLLTALVGEATAVGKNAGNRETSDEETIALVKKFVKNTQETIATLSNAGRDSSVQTEELKILNIYIPQQMDSDQLKEVFVTYKNSEQSANLGNAMRFLKENYAGLYDGRTASEVAKQVFV